MYTWGKGADGRLGFECDDGGDQTTPRLVEGPLLGKMVTSIACGVDDTAAIVAEI